MSSSGIEAIWAGRHRKAHTLVLFLEGLERRASIVTTAVRNTERNRTSGLKPEKRNNRRWLDFKDSLVSAAM